MLYKLFSFILDFLFPRRCIGCRRIEGVIICRMCMRRIRCTEQQVCFVCKRRSSIDGSPCSHCKPQTALDYLIIATHDTSGVTRRLIHFFKYRFVHELDMPLSGLMLQSFLKHIITNEDLALVPVPLHAQRQRWRGFNQSYLLARSIGNVADIAVLTHLLRRVKKTKPQATLSRAERLRNLTQAFACNGPLSTNKEIILIDDVATTRATLEACATTLKRYGAKRIGAIVVSRGT